jgi:hypothetical protein
MKYFIKRALPTVIVTATIALPLFANAQQNLFQTANSSAQSILDTVVLLTKVAFAAILLFFFWGIAKYIWGGAEEKEQAKGLLFWAVIAIFIAASIWGIVRVLQTTFETGSTTTGVTPNVT